MKEPIPSIPDDDLELDQLLARGQLSGRQYDAIAESVLAATAPRRRFSPFVWLPAAAVASAFGVWLFLGLKPGDGDFRAKSGGVASETVVSLGCGGSEPGVCRLGDTLMFAFHAGPGAGHLAAYAERIGEATPRRIWYFPNADGKGPRVEARSSTLVLPQGVRLGAPHTPGRYRVTLWLSADPVDRNGAAAPGPEHTSLTLEIVE